MSLKGNKIRLLQETQKSLRQQKSNIPTIQMQQQALRENLLLRKPSPEDKRAKTMRLQENQRVARDLAKQRKKDEQDRKRVVEEIARRNRLNIKERERKTKGIFFPKVKKR